MTATGLLGGSFNLARGRLRAIKLTLLALALAITPFCWSVARDLLPLLFADKDEVADVKSAIAIQLAAQHQRMHLGETPVLRSMSFPHNCYSVSKEGVRTNLRLSNKTIDGIDENFRSRSDLVGINSYGLAYHFLAERRGIEALRKNLLPFELAMLNGCMFATPFSRWCDAKIEKNMAVDFRLVEHDMVVRGLMRHAVDEHGSEILCTTVPAINDDAS